MASACIKSWSTSSAARLRLQAGRPHLWGAAFLFGWAVFMMLSLHVVEIIAWCIRPSRPGLDRPPGQRHLLLRQCLYHNGVRHGRPRYPLAQHYSRHRHLRPVYLCLDNELPGHHGRQLHEDRGAAGTRARQAVGHAGRTRAHAQWGGHSQGAPDGTRRAGSRPGKPRRRVIFSSAARPGTKRRDKEEQLRAAARDEVRRIRDAGARGRK